MTSVSSIDFVIGIVPSLARDRASPKTVVANSFPARHDYSLTFRLVEFNMSDQPVESVLRAFEILRELNRSRVTSVKDLLAATGLPKATLVRLLKTLGWAGYVTNDRRQGGYQVTSNVKALSCGYHRDPLVVEAARPWSIEFTRKYQWPIAVATLEERTVAVRFSTIIDSPNSPFHGTINLRLDLLTRALGRAYLAFCPAAERDMLLDLLGVGDAVRRQDALDMLGRIRKAGFSSHAHRIPSPCRSCWARRCWQRLASPISSRPIRWSRRSRNSANRFTTYHSGSPVAAASCTTTFIRNSNRRPGTIVPGHP